MCSKMELFRCGNAFSGFDSIRPATAPNRDRSCSYEFQQALLEKRAELEEYFNAYLSDEASDVSVVMVPTKPLRKHQSRKLYPNCVSPVRKVYRPKTSDRSFSYQKKLDIMCGNTSKTNEKDRKRSSSAEPKSFVRPASEPVSTKSGRKISLKVPGVAYAQRPHSQPLPREHWQRRQLVQEEPRDVCSPIATSVRKKSSTLWKRTSPGTGSKDRYCIFEKGKYEGDRPVSQKSKRSTSQSSSEKRWFVSLPKGVHRYTENMPHSTIKSRDATRDTYKLSPASFNHSGKHLTDSRHPQSTNQSIMIGRRPYTAPVTSLKGPRPISRSMSSASRTSGYTPPKVGSRPISSSDSHSRSTTLHSILKSSRPSTSHLVVPSLRRSMARSAQSGTRPVSMHSTNPSFRLFSVNSQRPLSSGYHYRAQSSSPSRPSLALSFRVRDNSRRSTPHVDSRRSTTSGYPSLDSSRLSPRYSSRSGSSSTQSRASAVKPVTSRKPSCLAPTLCGHQYHPIEHREVHFSNAGSSVILIPPVPRFPPEFYRRPRNPGFYGFFPADKPPPLPYKSPLYHYDLPSRKPIKKPVFVEYNNTRRNYNNYVIQCTPPICIK